MKPLIYIAAVCAALVGAHAAAEELRVPASTAYLDPNPEGARVSSRSGITGWSDPRLKILWFGEIKKAGTLTARVELRLPEGVRSKLRLSVSGHSRETELSGAGTNVVVASFGEFTIDASGYQQFTLESLNASPQQAGDIEALVLEGAAVEKAHFNLKPRRNAASVHLNYPVPQGTHVSAFYCEVTGVEDPPTTYYEACGWHRGYFGMQVINARERRIIFSVWDSGNEAVDRARVTDQNRVKLLAKGEDVYAGDFGNEGTGGHSHLKYLWKTGEPQKFLVTAQPTNGTFTIYSGYYFHPDKKSWMLISRWQAPKDGSWMRGLYSFSENFGGSTGHLKRKALYGNQWVRTEGGEWIELTTASFSHDSTGKADRLDRFMGVENGQFFLSQGGFVPGFTKAGEKFTRPAMGRKPDVAALPQ